MPGDTVLVVDDSPTITKLVQLVLAKAGHRVIAAGDARAAMDAAREERPALVLLDALLPEAEEVCRALRTDGEDPAGSPASPVIPVVLMTTRSDKGQGAGVAKLMALANVADSIKKPFAPEALTALVAHLLEPPAAGEAPRAAREPLPLRPDVPPERSPTGEIPLSSALSGDLALVQIADVMTLLQDEAHTGVLTLAKDDMRLHVSFRAGRIDLATALGVADEFLLGRFLLEARVVDEPTLARVIGERRAASAPPLLGADLVQRGLATAEGVRQAMSLQTAALVFEGLRWGAGRFWFSATEELPAAARDAALSLAVDALLIEGFRKVDEWRLIEREIGDFDMVFVRADEKIAAFGRGRLTRDELAVLEVVNGRNTVRDVVQLTKMGSFDTAKMLYRLLRTKLIRRRVAAVAT